MYNFTLSNGVEIPSIGYGTLNIGNDRDAVKVIKNAINNGYRHFDSAEVYGNDEALGIAIKESNISRNDFFITSKLSNDNRGYINTIKAFNETLKRMQLEYLDLYLIHWPASENQFKNWQEINIETWKALETLYKEGKVKAIGVSNFLIHHLKPLVENAEILPMINQLEIHPGQNQQDVVEYCRKCNILVEAWGPLGAGKMIDNTDLVEIAQKYNKSVAQICIKWCLEKNIIPLPKTVNETRMKENLDVYDFTILKNDIERINQLKYFAGSGLHPDKINF